MTDSNLFVALTRELLQRGCHVRFRAAGTSMHPAVRDGEVVTVGPSSGDAFAVGDVLLCRFGRRPAAHRVVAVQPSDQGRPVLHLRGDNLGSPDGPVRAEDVIGRVLTVNRGGRDRPLESPRRLVRLRRIARWLFAAAVVWATVMGASDALAQVGGRTLTWRGGNGRDWSTRQNWSPAEIPARGDNLVFPASPFLIANNDLVNLSVGSVTIRGNYDISGLALEITGDPGLLVESPAVTVTVALNLTLNRDPIHVSTNAGTLVLSGRITARNFVKQGGGTLVLSGANDAITDLVGEDGCGVIRATNPLALGVSLVGRIQLGQNCTLQVEANTTLDKPIIVNGMGAPGTAGALVISAGVRLVERLELRVNSPAKIGVLSGAALDLPDSAVGLTTNLNSPLTVNVAALGAVGMARVIAGTGDLIKEGAGLLFLDKNNRYNGQTTIKGGTVRIDGDQPDSPVLLDGGTVTGANDAGRMGTISVTALGGTISVGRPGVEEMGTGSLTLNAATTVAFEFNGAQYDHLVVTGSVALNGAVLRATGAFTVNATATIIHNDSNDAVIGTFAGLPEGAAVTIDGVPARVSYTGGDGNDVVLIPDAAEVLTGSYIGNGADNRPITGLGFQPDVVIIKANFGLEAVARTSTMAGDVSKNMATGENVSNAIQSLDSTGFTVGNSLPVNFPFVTYQWVAWKAAPGEMKVGTYTGNGAASQSIGNVGFSPDIVFVISGGADEPVHRVSAGPASNAFTFEGLLSTSYIPTLAQNAFTVGNNVRVNRAGTTYHYVAWNEIAGKVDVGTYTGNGNDNRNITGVGFQPDFLMVQTNNGLPTVAHSTAMGPSIDASHFFTSTGNQANQIQLLQSSGFQVGSAPESNGTTRTFTYAAWGGAAPTAIRMSALSARRTGQGVVVEWRTGYEVDNLGFHVYRGSSDKRIRLSASLITGSGVLQSRAIETGAGHSYHWSDETAAARAPDVEYWVEEIALSGARTWHGPVKPESARSEDDTASAPGTAQRSSRVEALTVGPSATAAHAPIAADVTAPEPDPNPPTARSAAAALTSSSVVAGASPAPSAALQRQWSIAAGAAVKVDITSAGWYRLTQPALVAAGLSATADPRFLQLVADGVEQRMRVNGAEDGRFDPQDSVEFYATGADTPYTGSRTYWIVPGHRPGRRTPMVDGRSAWQVGPSSFRFRVELKPRSVFFGALLNGDKENFFGPLIAPGESPQQVADLRDLTTSPPANAEIQVALQGVTDVKHRVGVRVNGVSIGEVGVANRGYVVRKFAIAQALLAEGANTISLEARGGETDYSLLDYIRLTYHRRYQARGNTLTFRADGGQQVTVAGFGTAGIRVMDINSGDAAREVRGTVTPNGTGWKVTLTVPGAGHHTLIAFASGAAASPVSLRANTPSTLHEAGLAGEIVMIAPAAFHSALAPLKSFRERQGHTVRIVDIEDVYDEFSYGQKTPQAIRDFMVRVTGEWSTPPRFLLLVGNATQDPRDYYGFGEPDHVPVRVVATGAMEAASDDWFVDADDDGYADLAMVGRLPARSAGQVATMVSKIIAYEQNGGGAWQRSVVMVSDRDPAGLVDYAALNERARAMLPADYHVTHIRRGTDPDAGPLVKARLSEGAAIVSYAGHGSVASWELDLLTSEDVPRLTNGTHLPLVIALNCFNGFFQSLFPEESLAEALVRAPDGGAIGVWASSGLTGPKWQASLNQELYRQIFQVGQPTIGEAMRAAKQIIGDPDVRRTWIYFGDPVTRLAGLPAQPAAMTSNAATAPTLQGLVAGAGRGDSTDADHATGLAAPVQRAAVRLADLDADGRDDPFLADVQSASWFSALGRGEFLRAPSPRWTAGEAIAADLDGDGGSDLFVYDPNSGGWLQATNLNDSRLITSSGSWGTGYRISAGDFDGDRRDELFGLRGATGAWFVAVPDGRGGFSYRSGSGLHDGDIRVADFDGDSRDDVFVYETSTGRWTLMLSQAKGPIFTRGNWGPGWDVTVARLNADRQADLFLWDGASGAWSGCIPDKAASFVCSSGRSPAGGRIQPLDRDGDGRDELLRYDARAGSWTLIELRPSGKVTQTEGVWEPGWSVASGDLDGDGRDDLALYNAKTGELINRLSRGSKWQDEASGAWPTGWLMVGRRP